MSDKNSIAMEAEELERLSVQLIQDQNWEELEKMLAPSVSLSARKVHAIKTMLCAS